ncbi:hypothetical protein B0H34DRAFT_689268 [Crassisporium funariophilum]|nr:hypothetical protein B0H34DRAFT_689268 [Crassisporium funariophilum]
MCYSSGSIDQAVNPCPMCKVFPPVNRCPHQRDICRNRALHPRMDVLFLKNAEVESFNGCGFCKWASTTPPPPPKMAGYNNPGWPGCCRAPSQQEYRLVAAADWRAVSIVHRVPIPNEIKMALDCLTFRGSPIQPTSPSSRSTPGKSTPVRKNSGITTPSKQSNILSTKPMNMPTQGRGRSPQETASAVTLSRSSSVNLASSSVPSTSSMDQHSPTSRRKIAAVGLERRVEGSQSSHSSPGRKSIDLENPVTPRRVSSVRRPTVTPATTSVSVSKVVANSRLQNLDAPVRRRASISGSEPVTQSQTTPRITDLPPSFIVPRTSKNDDDCSASSSSGSSGRGSLSDSTVTSDGGFTDYLSDESEAELQRQAEARAAVVAQNHAEELEFKMARQKLAHVDLRPPKSWNPTNTSSATGGNIPSATGNNFPASRKANIPAPSFGAAAVALAQSAQARG